MAKHMRQEIRGRTLVGRERILGNTESIKKRFWRTSGSCKRRLCKPSGRRTQGDTGETQRKKGLGLEER